MQARLGPYQPATMMHAKRNCSRTRQRSPYRSFLRGPTVVVPTHVALLHAIQQYATWADQRVTQVVLIHHSARRVSPIPAAGGCWI